MKLKNKLIKLTLIFLSLFSFNNSFAQIEFDSTKIKLIKIYDSENELRLVKGEPQDKKFKIIDDSSSIQFINIQTGNLKGRINKEKWIYSKQEKETLFKIDSSGFFEKDVKHYEVLNEGNYFERITSKVHYNYNCDVCPADVLKREIFDADENYIFELRPDLNKILFSPNHEFLVAMNSGIDNIDSIYFYSINGALIGSKRVFNGINVKISQDSKFVFCWANSPCMLMIFDNLGYKILDLNISNLLNSNLENVFSLENSDKILLSLMSSQSLPISGTLRLLRLHSLT